MHELANELAIHFVEEHNHFILPNFRKLYAKFNFESGGLIYGLVKTPEFYKSHPEKKCIPEIVDELKIRFNTSYWWPIWQFLYERIAVSDEIWLDIQNGNLKKELAFFCKVY